MEFKEFKDLIKKDLANYSKGKSKVGIKEFVLIYLKQSGFKYTFFLRLCKLLKNKKSLFLIYLIARVKFRRLSIRYGIQIPYYTDIKGGITIPHYSCIVIHGNSKIGENLSIRQGVTIGNTHKGVPTIGNNVYIGSGSAIVGKITIGNNVTIGVNSVITKDIPDNAVVAGNPAKILKFNK